MDFHERICRDEMYKLLRDEEASLVEARPDRVEIYLFRYECHEVVYLEGGFSQDDYDKLLPFTMPDMITHNLKAMVAAEFHRRHKYQLSEIESSLRLITSKLLEDNWDLEDFLHEVGMDRVIWLLKQQLCYGMSLVMPVVNAYQAAPFLHDIEQQGWAREEWEIVKSSNPVLARLIRSVGKMPPRKAALAVLRLQRYMAEAQVLEQTVGKKIKQSVEAEIRKGE